MGRKAAQPYQVLATCQVQQVSPEWQSSRSISAVTWKTSYQYERNPTDPRLSHALTLQVDAFGNPLKSSPLGMAVATRSYAAHTSRPETQTRPSSHIRRRGLPTGLMTRS
jgi:hypothetical protein